MALLVVHISETTTQKHYTTSFAYIQIIQNLQDFIRRNIGIYFLCFLCEFVRGEEVVKASSRVMISLRCTTSNGTCSYIEIALGILGRLGRTNSSLINLEKSSSVL